LEIGGAHDFAAVCFDRAALHPGKQPAIAHIVATREDGGRSLMYIRDALRMRGFTISYQSVANILARHEAVVGGSA
jgi:hypothetical protein